MQQHDDKRPAPQVSFSLTTLRRQIKTALAMTTDRELRGGLGHALKAIERHEQGKTPS